MLLKFIGFLFIVSTPCAIICAGLNAYFDKLIADRMAAAPGAEINPWNGLLDSFCHFLTALIVWLAAKFLSTIFISWAHFFVSNIPLGVACGILAVLVDLDHFVAAGSFSLQAATSLPERPFLHNSIVLILLLIAVIFASLRNLNPYLTAFSICLIALATQHIRDSSRRGLMFRFPVNVGEFNTPAISYYQQVVIIILLICFTSISLKQESLVINNVEKTSLP